MRELTLRPVPLTRAGHALGGLVVAPILGVPFSFLVRLADDSVLGETFGFLIALIPVAIGVLLAVRWSRMAVICRDSEIIVRGRLRTTRIPVDRVVTIHPTDAKIHWQDDKGARRVITVTAFRNGPRTKEEIARAHEQSMKQMRDWWRAGRQAAA